MTGEPTRWVPNLQIPHWNPSESDGGPSSPFPINAFPVNFNANAAGGNNSPPIESSNSLHRFLSNELDTLTEDFDMPIHAFCSDHFRMFEFKVRNCPRGRSHDWTECPFAHPAEKARRRDPRRYHYSGTACPEFRKGNCNKGDSCEFAHGVFECWLHPSRYRTQLCKDGTNCRRRVCFFAHTPEQLRVLTHGSTLRHAFDSSWSQNQNASFVSSPTSVLHSSPISSLSDSPPSSPGNPLYGGGTFNTVRVSEIVSSMRNVQIIDKVPSASTRGSKMGFVFGSPRGSSLRPGFFSLPSTPTGTGTKPETWWDQNCEEEPAMERVESGRELRAKIYAKLSRENSFGRSDTGFSVPDIGWVSELVK